MPPQAAEGLARRADRFGRSPRFKGAGGPASRPQSFSARPASVSLEPSSLARPNVALRSAKGPLPDSNALPVSRLITGHHCVTTVAIKPSPARGDIIKPGVSTPGRNTRSPKPSEPREGRHRRARRANAGDNGLQPNNPSPARGDIIKPGVSTPGETRARPNLPSPARGDIIKPGVSTPGGNRARPNHPSPARGDIVEPGVQTPGIMVCNQTTPAPQCQQQPECDPLSQSQLSHSAISGSRSVALSTHFLGVFSGISLTTPCGVLESLCLGL